MSQPRSKSHDLRRDKSKQFPKTREVRDMFEEIENRQRNVHPSPPLGILAIVFVVLFAASIATNSIMTSFAPYPTPYLPIEQLQAHYQRFPDASRVVSFFQLCASIPLGLFSSVIVSRLLYFKIRVAGVHIALFGGLTSSVFLGISAVTAWAMSQPGVASEAGAMRVVQLLAFAAGGFGHIGALGLLLAGVSVPSLAFKLMPRWVCWFGLVFAAICELSILSMVFPPLSALLPLGRFPGYIWLIIAGFSMPQGLK
jgi:hypothetical protein